MNIQLKRLVLRNFKGITFKDISFPSHVTTISGKNKAGKTTIFDAYSWCLFGKNSEDVKDFTIKTVGTSRLDHSVECTLDTGTKEIVFTKIYREKWVKKKGETTPEFSGHETECQVNGVPVSSTDYAREIDSIIQESTFKLLTNPFYFNSLSWNKKRELVFAMAGEISDSSIASVNPDFTAILQREPNLEKLKKELASKKALLNKNIKEIPTRISEVQNAITEDVNEAEVKVRVEEIASEIASIEAQVADSNKASQELLNRNFAREKEIMNFKTELLKIEGEIRNQGTAQLTEYNNKLGALQNRINQLRLSEKSLDTTSLKKNLEGLQNRIVQLRADIDKEDARQMDFNGIATACPVCKQSLPQDNLEKQKEELLKRFNADKLAKKNSITAMGLQTKSEIEALTATITETEGKLTLLREELATLEKELEFLQSTKPEVKPVDVTADPRYIAIQEKIAQVESQKEVSTPITGDLTFSKVRLSTERDSLLRSLTINEQNKQRKTRITQLEKEENDLAIQIAGLEKDEHTIAEFTKVKIQTIQNHINSMFTMVTFRLYEQLINGGEEETCIVLVDGVPFADANHAAKINAGVDIINTFSRHYGITCPIFIDNAEALNQVIPTPSQLIKLTVTLDEELTVANY